MIGIIDYGLGNLGSIKNMLKYIGYQHAEIVNSREKIDSVEKLILPGVGAFDNGMQNIVQSGLLEMLNENVLMKKKPILGICLGMQLLSKKSEEGGRPGLGWIDAETVRFRFEDENARLKVPHMGWNEVHVSKEHVLVKDLP